MLQGPRDAAGNDAPNDASVECGHDDGSRRTCLLEVAQGVEAPPGFSQPVMQRWWSWRGPGWCAPPGIWCCLLDETPQSCVFRKFQQLRSTHESRPAYLIPHRQALLQVLVAGLPSLTGNPLDSAPHPGSRPGGHEGSRVMITLMRLLHLLASILAHSFWGYCSGCRGFEGSLFQTACLRLLPKMLNSVQVRAHISRLLNGSMFPSYRFLGVCSGVFWIIVLLQDPGPVTETMIFLTLMSAVLSRIPR